MREIKFRALRTDGNGWVYGVPFYIQGERKCFIITNCQSGNLTQEDSTFDGYEVKYKSVGQFTGLKDKNGTEIWDGDMFAPESNNEEVKAVVRWDEDSAKFVVDSYGYNFHIGEGSQEVYDNELSICETYDLGDMSLEYCEVIGNIHTTHDKGKDETR